MFHFHRNPADPDSHSLSAARRRRSESGNDFNYLVILIANSFASAANCQRFLECFTLSASPAHAAAAFPLLRPALE